MSLEDMKSFLHWSLEQVADSSFKESVDAIVARTTQLLLQRVCYALDWGNNTYGFVKSNCTDYSFRSRLETAH